jgi:hypothetical protein
MHSPANIGECVDAARFRATSVPASKTQDLAGAKPTISGQNRWIRSIAHQTTSFFEKAGRGKADDFGSFIARIPVEKISLPQTTIRLFPF